nr:hypothetical protein [Bacteroidota bacterium]
MVFSKNLCKVKENVIHTQEIFTNFGDYTNCKNLYELKFMHVNLHIDDN